MDRPTFENWLDAYRRAWEGRDPEAAADLYTADAAYYEAPFEAPARGREDIQGSNSAVELDGIFLVKLDADGRCAEFREWWHKIG